MLPPAATASAYIWRAFSVWPCLSNTCPKTVRDRPRLAQHPRRRQELHRRQIFAALKFCPSHSRPSQRHQPHRRKRRRPQPVQFARVELSANVVEHLLRIVFGLRRIDVVLQRRSVNILARIPARAARQSLHQFLRQRFLSQPPVHLRQRHFRFRIIGRNRGRRFQFRARVGISPQLREQQAQVLER